ncbi:hypothetical protein BDZ89DRAFT_1062130 [Hymenopellis radicata]|nr:hypothetical protein BDZ89DRAFT_1062130 [Hymenopellis radicata]
MPLVECAPLAPPKAVSSMTCSPSTRPRPLSRSRIPGNCRRVHMQGDSLWNDLSDAAGARTQSYITVMAFNDDLPRREITSEDQCLHSIVNIRSGKMRYFCASYFAQLALIRSESCVRVGPCLVAQSRAQCVCHSNGGMPYGGLVVLMLVTCANVFSFVADSQAHRYITTSSREGNDMYFASNQFTEEAALDYDDASLLKTHLRGVETERSSGIWRSSPRCLSLHCTGVNEKASRELRSPVIDIARWTYHVYTSFPHL